MLKSMVQGKAKKHLDVDRIAQIKQAAGTYLTLHGGSGTDDERLPGPCRDVRRLCGPRCTTRGLARRRQPRGPPAGGQSDGAGARHPAAPAAGAALVACFAALVMHTMTYAAFLEDPFTWGILGVALGVTGHAWAVAAPRGVSRPVAEPLPAPA